MITPSLGSVRCYPKNKKDEWESNPLHQGLLHTCRKNGAPYRCCPGACGLEDRRASCYTNDTKMVGCIGNAPTRPSLGHPLYRRLAVFTRLTTLKWLRGRESNPRLAAYETAAFPLGDPAMIKIGGEGCDLCAPAPLRQKRTNTAANSDLSSHPQDCFTADLSVFQAHLPVHD